jgi:hypothetical protein
VGPLCCDPSRSEGDPGSKCGVDYKTCGSSREVMEEYALCLSKGLACDLNTLKCCNMYGKLPLMFSQASHSLSEYQVYLSGLHETE